MKNNEHNQILMNEGGGLISRAGAGLPQKTKISELDNCVKSFEEIFLKGFCFKTHKRAFLGFN